MSYLLQWLSILWLVVLSSFSGSQCEIKCLQKVSDFSDRHKQWGLDYFLEVMYLVKFVAWLKSVQITHNSYLSFVFVSCFKCFGALLKQASTYKKSLWNIFVWLILLSETALTSKLTSLPSAVHSFSWSPCINKSKVYLYLVFISSCSQKSKKK